MPEVVVVLCLIDSSLLKYRNDILNTSEVISLYFVPFTIIKKMLFIYLHMIGFK